MADNELPFTFTMDCEQVVTHQGTPSSWDLGELAIRGLCHVLLAHGLGATLFAVPKVADCLQVCPRELHQAGIEVGLHYHPQDHSWSDFLGTYPEDEQREMLLEAKTRWAETLGWKPSVFWPGNFSANDGTFPVLVSLGATWLAASGRQGRCVPRNYLLGGRLTIRANL